MNRNLLVVTTALSAAMSAGAAVAQAPAAAASQPAAATAAAPQAVPAKVALIAFEQSVFATNEGQRAVQDVQKKYEPKKAQIDTLAGEVDSLKKQLQSAPATLSDEERQTRLRNIDAKEKVLTRDSEDATQAYQADLQEAYTKVAQKVSGVAKSYVQASGFTLLLDVSNQASNVMWAVQNTDITQAVVEAYNKSSGVTAPPPAAPSAGRSPTSVPRATPPTTAPRTTPRTAAPPR